MSHGGVRDLLRLQTEFQHVPSTGRPGAPGEARPDCLCSSKEGLRNRPQHPPRHEAPEGSVPSPLTTRRQDRGQGGGLSFILRPRRVETEQRQLLSSRCVFPDRAGRERRWGDGAAQAEGWGSLPGQHGLGGLPGGGGLPASSMNSQLPQAKQGSVGGRDRQLRA